MESKRALILEWLEQNALNKNQATEILSAVNVLPSGLHWRLFLQTLLTWLGGLALTFSLLFFIAYNWEAMGRFAKFALVEVSIIVCLITYWRIDSDKVTAKASLTMAMILLGVLLAFYGQTYQTGADPWQLFANWALLILPWVIVAQFASMWLIWLLLLNLSLVLYFQAAGFLFGLLFSSTHDIFWVLFLFNSFVWGTWEFAVNKFTWLNERWAVRLIAITCGFSISYLMLIAIIDDYSSDKFAIVLYFSWVASLYYFYRRRIPDLFMLAGLCFSGIVVITAFFANLFFTGNDPIGAFFFLAFIVIGLAAASAKWLKKIQKEMLQ